MKKQLWKREEKSKGSLAHLVNTNGRMRCNANRRLLGGKVDPPKTGREVTHCYKCHWLSITDRLPTATATRLANVHCRSVEEAATEKSNLFKNQFREREAESKAREKRTLSNARENDALRDEVGGLRKDAKVGAAVKVLLDTFGHSLDEAVGNSFKAMINSTGPRYY